MKLKTNELIICSLFASLTAILTQISIPLPMVPLTMQIFAVTLCGLVLGKRLGFISQIIYVLLGAIGLPVFSKFGGGIGIILGPTGGFILSFPIVAFVVGYFCEKFKSTIGIMLGMIFSLLISYIIGTIQFCIVTNSDFVKGLTICVIPFIIVDIIKLSLATVVGKSILKRVNLGYSIKTS
ncbi:biotin transporter BioY [Romboutsia ilealis]|uniref:biotin transporter BioY n=1 Tax=Romboutsia ilealis TaxID=1115758 RepID=UPI00272B8D16|nr:biotin transporter BioY [Romboutsia ilealis]